MAETTSSQFSPLCVFSFPDSPNNTTPRNKDQFIFEIRVYTSLVSMIPNKKKFVHNLLAKKTFKCSRKAFFSNQTNQRDLLHMMFQHSDIPFCLENIYWSSRFTKHDETASKLENLDKVVTRVLEVARDCPQDICTLIIHVTKYDPILHQDEVFESKHTQDFRSKQPLDGWIKENMNDVNIVLYHKFIYEKLATKSTADNKYLGLESVVMGKDDDEEPCSICIKKFIKGSLAVCMPCSHVFHGSCIFRWLSVISKCPLCRFELFPKEESNLEIDFSFLMLNDL